MDLERLLADYAVWHEVSGHSSKTIAIYRWAIGAFRAWLVANSRPTTVSEITLADARAFLQAEQHRDALYPDHPTSPSRAGKLSDRTIHLYARSLRAFFHWLESEA
jgi:site-specific recombinase XerD